MATKIIDDRRAPPDAGVTIKIGILYGVFPLFQSVFHVERYLTSHLYQSQSIQVYDNDISAAFTGSGIRVHMPRAEKVQKSPRFVKRSIVLRNCFFNGYAKPQLHTQAEKVRVN